MGEYAKYGFDGEYAKYGFLREHLLDVKNKGSDLSKPVARHFNLPGHSHEHMEICGTYLHLGNNETRKRKEQRLIFKP